MKESLKFQKYKLKKMVIALADEMASSNGCPFEYYNDIQAEEDLRGKIDCSGCITGIKPVKCWVIVAGIRADKGLFSGSVEDYSEEVGRE